VTTHDTETPESLAWAELQRRGSLRERYTRGLEQEISAELARCLDPVVHEQDIRPYGAMIARETPHLERLGRAIDAGDALVDVLRSMADGVHSVLLLVKHEPPRLLLLREPMDSDQDYASHAVWVDGIIVCNDAHGVVRIVTDSSVTIVEGRRWIKKDMVYEAIEDIAQVVPAAEPSVVRRLLELSHHRFSPNGVGATLIYELTEHVDAGSRRDEGIDVSALGLSVMNESDEPLLLHQARYRDGALLVGHDGRLEAVNVILRPTRASEQAVAAVKGTRHTSAARHSYDCPNVLAFVVSTDGPVTVFSDGQRIADLKHAARPKTPAAIDELIAARRIDRRRA
jgi:DNA integrity scanning protein DisA with diadenylate cyclase activity